MTTAGIIPAAGKASRWGGNVYKELLPMPNGYLGIQHTALAMEKGKADFLIVVTTQEKMPLHVAALNAIPLTIPVTYIQQYREGDIFGAILSAITIPVNHYMFAMPDTYYPQDTFKIMKDYHSNFTLGMFVTRMHTRFGMIDYNGNVHDKPQTVISNHAWGTAMWSHFPATLWRCRDYPTYAHAFNAANQAYGHEYVIMPYYYDLATLQDYSELLRGPQE